MMAFKLNLQLFAQEKTEKATPKKRQETRKKGQIAKSQEINSAFVLLFAFILLKFYLPFMFTEMKKYTVMIYSSFTSKPISVQETHSIFIDMIILSAKLAFPVMLVAVITGMLVSYLQVGFLFTLEPLQIKLERLDPIQGFKRIFSKRSLVELVKSVLKILAVSYISYLTIKGQIQVFPQLLDIDLYEALQFLGKIAFDIAWRVALLLIILAIIDVIYQRWEHEQSIKMSKHDVKEEHKQIEGNPQIKSKIKEKQRQVAMSRMMQDVPKANVIITNPIHLAIALKYDEGMAAPKVLAKGQDKVAERIKEIGTEHSIPIFENKTLAQALYKSVDVGELVPPDFYQAIAEVLAFIYQLANERGKYGGGKNR
jgi:flagellar biosynthetic protein FlhB